MYVCVFMQINLIGAGFRSRVRYINVLDPSSMCYYISEILDAGRDSPLFMVPSPYLMYFPFWVTIDPLYF